MVAFPFHFRATAQINVLLTAYCTAPVRTLWAAGRNELLARLPLAVPPTTYRVPDAVYSGSLPTHLPVDLTGALTDRLPAD